ncbi:hypothetical protein [Dactylosporangium sp. NPDC051484]
MTDNGLVRGLMAERVPGEEAIGPGRRGSSQPYGKLLLLAAGS